MTTVKIPRNVVAEDHRLEGLAEKDQERLAKHRWHNTLDPKGPGYSIREYASAIGRHRSTVATFAKAYDAWVGGGRASATLSDCMMRVNLTGEKAEAAEAVAQVRGITARTARDHHRAQVNRTVQNARERVEKTGGSMSKAIKTIAKEDEVIRQATKRKQMSEPITYVKITKDLLDAKRSLNAALRDARGHRLGEDWTDMLVVAVDQVQGVLELVRMAISGNTKVDWDAELAKLGAS